MANRSIDILISARDQASAAFKSAQANAAGFGASIKSVGSGVRTELGGMMSSFKGMAGSAMSSAGALGPLAAAAVALKGSFDFAVDSFGKFQEQAKQDNKLAAVLRATGYEAGFTSSELKKMASDLQGLTDFSDQATMSSQSILLTFKNIRKEGGVFGQTVALAQDLATVLDGDLKSSTMQLGKALNDPIQGVNALKDAGISFTDQQREQIKVLVQSGNVLSAQKVILAEVAAEVGGAAQASASATTQLANSWTDLKESFGGVVNSTGITDFLKTATSLVNGLNDSLKGSPLLQFAIARGINPLQTNDRMLQQIGTDQAKQAAERRGVAAAEAARSPKARVSPFAGFNPTANSNRFSFGGDPNAEMRRQFASAGMQIPQMGMQSRDMIQRMPQQQRQSGDPLAAQKAWQARMEQLAKQQAQSAALAATALNRISSRPAAEIDVN